MDQNAQQTRHIAANLEHGADGSTTLHTSVQHETLHHDAVKKVHEAHDVTANSAEVQDVGWDDDQIRPEDYAIDGIKNEDIWLLVRRFNKVRLHTQFAKSLADLNHSAFSISNMPQITQMMSWISTLLRRSNSLQTNCVHSSRDFIWGL
jgi:hypothetical protein